MLYLQIDSDNRILGVRPQSEYDRLTQKQKDEIGNLYPVTNIPEPVKLTGKIPKQFYNPDTKEFWTEYEDEPKTEADILKAEIAELWYSDMILEFKLNEEVANLYYEIMMGGM